MVRRIRGTASAACPFANPPVSCIMSHLRDVVLEGEEGIIELRPRPWTCRYCAQDMVEGATDRAGHSTVVV